MQASGTFNGKEGIPYRPLGKTGEKVSMWLGGFHIVKEKFGRRKYQNRATAIITALISWIIAGIITTVSAKSAWAKALQDGYRNKAF